MQEDESLVTSYRLTQFSVHDPQDIKLKPSPLSSLELIYLKETPRDIFYRTSVKFTTQTIKSSSRRKLLKGTGQDYRVLQNVEMRMEILEKGLRG